MAANQHNLFVFAHLDSECLQDKTAARGKILLPPLAARFGGLVSRCSR
jgi:hypothetical protein